MTQHQIPTSTGVLIVGAGPTGMLTGSRELVHGGSESFIGGGQVAQSGVAVGGGCSRVSSR